MENTTQEKGVALFMAVLIMSVILAISLGISGILIQQIKISENIGDSVVSFYAADSGVEREIYNLYKETSHSPTYSGDMIIAESYTASYTVFVRCSTGNADCQPEGEFADIPVITNPDDPEYCAASNFCIKSVGTFQTAKRAIEVKY